MNPFQIAGSGQADWRAAAQSLVATAITRDELVGWQPRC